MIRARSRRRDPLQEPPVGGDEKATRTNRINEIEGRLDSRGRHCHQSTGQTVGIFNGYITERTD